MKYESVETKIKTLAPDIFKRLHITVNVSGLPADMQWSDFYIYDLASKDLVLNFPLPPHRKTVNDLIYIHQGRTARASGIDHFVSESDSLTMIPAFTITETFSMDEGTQGYYCHYSDEFLIGCGLDMADLTSLKSAMPVFVKLNDACAGIIYATLKRIAYLYQKKSGYDLIRLYLLTIFKEIEMYNQNNETSLKKQSNIRVEKFKSLVSKNLHKHRDMSFYASLMNITPNHLNKIIKKEAGISAMSMINKMVVLEIKVLLLQTNLSISQIAFDLNFNDVSHFSKFFLKHTNINPSTFRKMIEIHK